GPAGGRPRPAPLPCGWGPGGGDRRARVDHPVDLPRGRPAAPAGRGAGGRRGDPDHGPPASFLTYLSGRLAAVGFGPLTCGFVPEARLFDRPVDPYSDF